jgi:hypothetical protein
MKTYQLSKSGIERLERFKRDVENGDCSIRVDLTHFTIKSANGIDCCFASDESKVRSETIKNIEHTLGADIKKEKHSDGMEYFCAVGGKGVALLASDVETKQ